MKKKAAAPEPAGESAPMWIVSFADLVTLLMSFFVVLYALKQDGSPQEEKILAAIRFQFDPNYVPPLDSSSAFDQELIRLHNAKSGPPLPNNGGNNTSAANSTDGRDNRVTALRPGQQIKTGGKINFDLNDTKLDEASMKTVQQLVEILRGKMNVLYVKGHVSADEIKPDDPGGMTLSNKRAQVVVEELVRMGIDRRVMRPFACGPYEPLKTGAYDAATLRQNRRVEVYATDNTASQYVPASIVPATTSHESGGTGAEAPRPKPAAKTESKPETKSEAKPEPKTESRGH